MAISPLGVITEFKFEVGSALIATKSLTGAVDTLNDSVDGAIDASANLGLAFAANLGFGGGSLLGIASTAIQVSETFDDVSRSFATIISANKDKLTGTIDTFNDRLMTSGVIIKDLVKDARTFGIDEKSLINSTKLLSAALAPKGLAGQNFEVPRELSRNLLKSAPLLGIDPAQTEGQLLRLIGGQASLGDTLFRRLTAETTAFGAFGKKGGTKAFNALEANKRIDILRRGLGQFTRDTEVLEDRLNSINNQFTIFRQTIRGVDGILRPLGATLKKPLVEAMKFINVELNTTGRKLVSDFSVIMGQLLSSPRNLLINLLQLKSAGEDLKRTGDALGRAGIAGTVALLANKLFKLPRMFIGLAAGISLVGSVLEKLVSGIMPDFVGQMISMGSMIAAGTAIVGAILLKFGVLGTVLGFVGAAFSTVIAPAIAIFGVMQLISRAIAISRLKDAELIPKIALQISEATTRIFKAGSEIMGVMNLFFNTIAGAIAPLFSVKNTTDAMVLSMNFLASGMELVRDTVLVVSATFNGLSSSMALFAVNLGTIFDSLFSGNFAALKSNPFEGLSGAFDDGFTEFLAKATKPGVQGGQAFVNNTTNINGAITIRNEFKEQQEPDRVAFTIKDQLLKAAQNPTGAAGFSLSSGLVGG